MSRGEPGVRGPTLSCHAHLRPESQALVPDPWRSENPEWVWVRVKENPSKISQLKDGEGGGGLSRPLGLSKQPTE